MSKETMQHLNTQTLIGFTSKRGNAWHYRADLQGDEPNHYAGAVPVVDIERRLFNWDAVEVELWAHRQGKSGMLEYVLPDHKGIARSDSGEVLGIFKKGYRIHQFKQWLVQNEATLLDADLQVGSAGLLRNGAQAWVQIEMEETLNVRGVEFRPFLTAATSHDGSIATTYVTGAQVVVCDNTLSAALAGSDRKQIKVRHSVNSMNKLQDARDALGIVYNVADAFTAQIEALTEQKVTDAMFRKFVQAYTNPKDAKATTQMLHKADALMKLWKDDERVTPWKGTAWGVVSAVNTYVHHVQTVRGIDRAERNMERVVTGKINQLDQSTLDLLAAV